MKKDNKIILLIIIIIIIIMTIIAMLIILLKDRIVIEDKGITHDIETEHEDEVELKEVNTREQYYAIKNIINKYYTNINYLDAKIEDLDVIEIETEQEKQKVIEEYTKTGIEALKKLLDKESIQYLQLNDKRILENFKQYKNTTYNIEEMYYYKESINTNIYYVKLKIDNKKETSIVVKIDLYNETFSIYPEQYIEEKSINENNIQQKFATEEIQYIEPNDENAYEEPYITDEAMAQYYLYDYGDTVLNNVEEAYAKLEEEYRKAKFPTLNEYVEYINKSEKRYEMLELKKYSIQDTDEDMTYVCIDQYGNKYTFKETSIMKYTVKLDSYTIEDEEYRQNYGASDNKERGILSLDKFFEMLNMQDYEKAYNVLDEGFKQNYFPTQLDFENYIKQHTFKYNKVTYTQYSNKISSLHTYNVEITDQTEKSGEIHKLTIIVKLLEDTKFSLSFEVE